MTDADETAPGANRRERIRLEQFPEYGRWFRPGSPEERQFRLMRRIGRISRLWLARFEEELRPLGQTQSRWEVLMFLALWGDGATQAALAKRMEIEGPSLVRLLDKLEHDGLVERVASGVDRRAKLVHLTAAGVDMVTRLTAVTNASRKRLLHGVGDREMDQAMQVLDRILGELEG